MREIKFRAWDEMNKTMHNDFQFIKSGETGSDWIIFISDKQKLSGKPHPLDTPFFQQQLKVMQFTGLRDRNGKEIYEGDVYQVAKNVIYQVVFVGTPEVFEDEALMGGFGLQRIENADVIIPFDTYSVKHGEIIGSIYENPELLNTNT